MCYNHTNGRAIPASGGKRMSHPYDYLIVGAGLFGAVFAQQAREAGKRCLVIDRRAHVGGNIYTEEIEGIQVHRYGAHIFHTGNRAVWDYVGRFAEFNRFTNAPLARYGNELYHLPFNMNTFHALWGVTTPAEARAKVAEQVAAAGVTGEPKNLEEQALSLVGRTSMKSSSRATPKSSGAEAATSCPRSSSGGCRCASPMTTTTSATPGRASPSVAIRAWWSACWRAPKCG